MISEEAAVSSDVPKVSIISFLLFLVIESNCFYFVPFIRPQSKLGRKCKNKDTVPMEGNEAELKSNGINHVRIITSINWANHSSRIKPFDRQPENVKFNNAITIER